MRRLLLALAFLAAAVLPAQENTAFRHSKAKDVVDKSGGPALPAGYFQIQNSGTNLTMRTVLDFSTGMSCSDDAANNRTVCTSSGGGGSTPTGTGFVHVTSGTQDGASKTVDVSSGDITGILACADFPALTGDVTTSSGSCATTIGNTKVSLAKIANAGNSSRLLCSGSSGSGASYSECTVASEFTFTATAFGITANGITNADLAQAGAFTIKGNATGSTANETDMSMATFAALTANCRASPTTCTSLFEDFTGHSSGVATTCGDNAGWVVVNGAGTGTGSSCLASATNHPGIIQLSTGTTGTTASSTLVRNDSGNGEYLLNGAETWDWLVQTSGTLSTTNDHYEVEVGLTLGGTTSVLEAASGMFFEYSDNVNSGKWFFHSCRISGHCTTVDTTVTVATSTWYHLKLVANSATSYEVFVNGTDAGAMTTTDSIPTALLTQTLKIYCTNNTAASAKTISADYFWYLQTGLSR